MTGSDSVLEADYFLLFEQRAKPVLDATDRQEARTEAQAVKFSLCD